MFCSCDDATVHEAGESKNGVTRESNPELIEP